MELEKITIEIPSEILPIVACTEMLLSKEQTKSPPLMSFFNHVAINISGILNSIKDGSLEANSKEEL